MTSIRRFTALAGLSVLAATVAASGLPSPAPVESSVERQQDSKEKVNPRWLDRLEDRDRRIIDYNLGFAPPALPDDATWYGKGLAEDSRNWDALRDKVVILQSWSSQSSGGRGIPSRLERIAETLNKKDVDHVGDLVIIAVHTPEGADNAGVFLERREAPVPVMVDANGTFLDKLGIFDRPTNVIVDRHGVARMAGIRLNALADAAELLLGEVTDLSVDPPVLLEASDDEGQGDASSTSSSGSVSFPPIRGEVSHARDIRGQQAPALPNIDWVANRPTGARGKVLVLDFWATWCGPCVRGIPHMNELARAFPDDAVVIGLSDETRSSFENGMRKLGRSPGITLSDFDYAVGLDPTRSMNEQILITGIPHCIVISSDNIVRWQGHPSGLDRATLERIVAANKQLNAQNQDDGATSRPDAEEQSGPRVRQFLPRWQEWIAKQR